jgi:hypothetical protein
MNKPFSPALYSNDTLARLAIFNIFKENRHYSVEETENQYGVDLYLLKGINKVCGLELEVKLGWVKDFPFPDVQFLARKSHYLNVLWVLFNKDCSKHLTWKIDLTGLEKRIVPNKYLEEEVFYAVPLDRVVFDGLKVFHS